MNKEVSKNIVSINMCCVFYLNVFEKCTKHPIIEQPIKTTK